VFVGGASASIGSTDLGDAALDELATRAVAMARAAPADKYAGLAPGDRLAKGPFADLDLEDAAERSPQDLRAAAEEAEDAARAVAGVTNSEGAGASAGRGVVALATSHGFSGAYAATSHRLSASVVAGEGGAMQRDYSWRSGRHAADLLPPEIGRRAGTAPWRGSTPASSRAERCRWCSIRASGITRRAPAGRDIGRGDRAARQFPA
jgi:PmbA protein